MFIIRHTLLKLCYAIEIGAYLAYKGHYEVTKDPQVRRIAKEELRHMSLIRKILIEHQEAPNKVFNFSFLAIGYTVRFLCRITPRFLLDQVAGILEKFNVITYSKMAQMYPEHYLTFLEMQKNELEHEGYFLKLI